MERKSHYSLTTRCFTLRCGHPQWLECTQLFYNKILLFYYNLFLDLAEKDAGLPGLNSQRLLRELEIRTIEGRDKYPVPFPLPWGRVPLYFRRAAANAGIAAGRSWLNRHEQLKRADCFHESVTFYKGTYKDFDQTQITLKVWTGSDWRWMRCRLSGSSFPEKGEILSPGVALKPTGIYLHVPVRERVENGRTLKECTAEGVSICCVQFTNGDHIAVCAVQDGEGCLGAVRFLKGGNSYRHSCNEVLDKLEKSKASTAGQEALKANRKYWTRLQNLSVDYSHRISRQIVDFAVDQNCGVIVLPKFDEGFSRMVMKKVGNWSPLHLSGRVRSQLAYKAWRQGILVIEAEAGNTGNKCSSCGAPIKKRGEEFCCANGHRGSRHLNTALNLGIKCREGMGNMFRKVH